jgi:hypothetical integral membrane protein (TIGR02206 family)
VVSPVAYWVAVGIGAAIGTVLCVAARRRPGPWTLAASRTLALLLAATAVAFVVYPIVDGTWSVRSSLPLDLCDVALMVAALACWQPAWQWAVELTYFWGLAGTLQAVSTPDLSVAFPHLAFFVFVVGHLAIVLAAIFLVVGLGLVPRRGAVPRVFAITAGYTAFVGLVDWRLDANYMFLRAIPGHASLLSVLGPWPWYLLSAAAVALALLLVLDLPFRHHH